MNVFRHPVSYVCFGQAVLWARLGQTAQRVGVALLAGLVVLLGILLSGAGEALGDLLAPLLASQPLALLLAAGIVLGALAWALQRWLEKRK